jgi:hypothetical protein
VGSVVIVKSTDPGAPTLSGTVGALLVVLDEALIIGRLFTTADDATFTDRSAEARLDGGTAFLLFPTPGTGDRAYFGFSTPFRQLVFDLATPGAGGAYAWEYWDGTGWAALTVTDGTNGFTQDGTVAWTPPADWATNTVNGQTRYWVRVRPTTAPTTNPTCSSVSVTGWLRGFEETNKAAYRQAAKAERLRMFLRVQDDAPGAGGAKEARLRGFEAMTDVDTGTGAFPTATQLSTGIIARKSATANATARAWVVSADGRTVYVWIATEDTAGYYYVFAFGDIVSYVPGDQYGVIIIGRTTENNSALGGERIGNLDTSGSLAVNDGHYVARSYTGVGGSLQVGKHVDAAKARNNHIGVSGLAYTNPADGKLWVSPVWIHESAQPTVRGYMRGFFCPLHSATNFSDGDTFSGSGPLAGKSFRIMKSISSSAATPGCAVLETSDTWDAD